MFSLAACIMQLQFILNMLNSFILLFRDVPPLDVGPSILAVGSDGVGSGGVGSGGIGSGNVVSVGVVITTGNGVISKNAANCSRISYHLHVLQCAQCLLSPHHQFLMPDGWLFQQWTHSVNLYRDIILHRCQ